MDIVGNIKNALNATLTLAKQYILPMFFGLIVIGIICAIIPSANKWLQ